MPIVPSKKDIPPVYIIMLQMIPYDFSQFQNFSPIPTAIIWNAHTLSLSISQLTFTDQATRKEINFNNEHQMFLATQQSSILLAS